MSKFMSKWKAILSYLIVALYLFFEMGVQVSPSVMTDPLMKDLHLGVFELGLMSGFYFYTYTLMQIPSGLLFDRYSPRFVISGAILVCALGCLAFAFSQNLWMASLARMLMGLGSAFAFVAVLVVTADLFPSRYFAFITGITQMLAALGAMAGQMPLGLAVMHWGWRHTLWILAAIGFVLAVVVWLVLNYKKDVLSHAQSHSQSQSQSENQTQQFYALFKRPQTWMIALYACLLWAPMSGFASLWGVPFLEGVYGLDHATAAWVCSMMWLGLALASPVLGWWSTQMASRTRPLMVASFLGLVAFAVILLFPSAPISVVTVAVFLCGAACSGQALSFTVVKEINNPRQRGAAIAFNNMAVVISGAIFQPLLGKLLAVQCDGVASASHCASSPMRLSMLLILAVYLISWLIASFAIKEPKEPAK
jgi:MFS family permease